MVFSRAGGNASPINIHTTSLCFSLSLSLHIHIYFIYIYNTHICTYVWPKSTRAVASDRDGALAKATLRSRSKAPRHDQKPNHTTNRQTQTLQYMFARPNRVQAIVSDRSGATTRGTLHYRSKASRHA